MYSTVKRGGDPFPMENKHRNVLVIEDNRDVLDGILNILEYAGYQPKGMTRFSENLFEKMQSEPLGLIILDVMLSGNDGRDLARRFKNSAETREVPILMISAYTNVENSAREAGADDFLQKPFGMDELIQKIEQYL